jgi:hypothetical protein
MNMDLYTGCVDVRDVARSLITLYEDPSAQGRHLCLESLEPWIDFTNKIANLYPELPIHRWVIFGTTRSLIQMLSTLLSFFLFMSESKKTNKGGLYGRKTPPRNCSIWVSASFHSTQPSGRLWIASEAKDLSRVLDHVCFT